jgi:uroporphyrinogen-III decarboxylase
MVRWTITEPEEKVKHYLDLCLQERLAALDFYRDVAAANGCEFFCIFGGARTWGPKQLTKFADVDRIFLDKARQIFPYVFWHHCGHNLPESLEALATWPGIKAVQYDMPYYSQKLTWPEFYEQVARRFAGRRCAMNAPTTQVACYGSTEEVHTMVRDFIDSTLPHTTAVIMPGCEIDSYAPLENVQTMINAAREKKL